LRAINCELSESELKDDFEKYKLGKDKMIKDVFLE